MTTPADRYRLHAQLADNPKRQAAKWVAWKRDVKLWVRECGWSYDPRRSDLPTFPFVPWERQEELLDWITARFEGKEEGAIDKSRDTGVSWTTVYWAVHRWLFHDGFKATWGSRKAELVDKIGDPDTILEKARILIRWLPKWLQPAGFKVEDHALHMKIRNPQNGSILTGATGDNLARAGRASILFVDEAAFLEHAEIAEAAARYVSPCRIYLSTANAGAIGGPFYRKLKGGKIPVFTIRWSDDPTKDQAWYQKELESGDESIVRQELDGSWEEGADDVCFPLAWIQAAVQIDDIAPVGELVAGLDVAAFGSNENVLAFRRGPVVLPLVSWRGRTTRQTAGRAAGECEDRGAECLCYDVGGLGEGVRGDLQAHDWPFVVKAIASGSEPSKRWYNGKPAADRFRNLRAELFWGILRPKFRRTWERLHKGEPHADEDCISLPDDPKLIQQFASIKYERMDTGRIKIESKEKARKRGIASPDRADAVALSYAVGAGGHSQAFEEADVDFGPPRDMEGF